MKPSPEMVWLTAFTAALKGGANSHDALLRADFALEKFKDRFPEWKGNG